MRFYSISQNVGRREGFIEQGSKSCILCGRRSNISSWRMMLEAPNAQFVKLSTILTSRNLLFASSFFVAGAAFRMPGMPLFRGRRNTFDE